LKRFKNIILERLNFAFKKRKNTNVKDFIFLTILYFLSITIVVGSCPSRVSNFSYFQTYNNSLEDYNQDVSNDFDSTFDLNSTPSSGTSPTYSSEGSHYIFIENSSNHYSEFIFDLWSLCFDLTPVSNALMFFTAITGYLSAEPSPQWWQVDIENAYIINPIRVMNYYVSSRDRNDHITVETGISDKIIICNKFNDISGESVVEESQDISMYKEEILVLTRNVLVNKSVKDDK